MQLWSKTTFLLYYFVLAFEESCVGPLMLPHFKHVEMVLNPDVCLVSSQFVIFCLGFVFLFFLFLIFLTRQKKKIPADLFILTAQNLNPIDLKKEKSLSRSLSQTNDTTKSIVPILYM